MADVGSTNKISSSESHLNNKNKTIQDSLDHINQGAGLLIIKNRLKFDAIYFAVEGVDDDSLSLLK